MLHKSVNTVFSTFVVKCLGNIDKSITIPEIAKIIGEEEEFVNRVRKGQECFKIEHLLKIGKACKEPLPSILLKEIEKTDIAPKNKSAYKNLREAIRAYERFRKILLSEDFPELQKPPIIEIRDISRRHRKKEMQRKLKDEPIS